MSISGPDNAVNALRVVLLGDSDTVNGLDHLDTLAAQNGTEIVDMFSFETGAAAANDNLADVDAVVDALAAAITARVPVWMPYPREDLWREQHFRRLAMVLQRHGLNLLYGTDLAACTTEGGMTEIDFALRAEVRAVDELDRAALALVGAETLSEEIEFALSACHDTNMLPPVLPSPELPWVQRRDALARFAAWLVRGSGVAATGAADCLNATGHRTRMNKEWDTGTVAALLKSPYFRAP
jgi:hypothetical protein